MSGGDKRKLIMIEDGVDRISELPAHLSEHILGCLSIKDAVATSVLSSKWRYRWTGLRTLNFDYEFWYCYGDFTASDHTRVIDRVLLLHCGPIREFILFVPNFEHKVVDINMWLHVLSKKGVQKIEIDAMEYYHKNQYYPIPLCLFHCRELKELSLFNFIKHTLPSDFKVFANLTSLSLDNVVIASSLLGSLISGCLLLETLSLKDLRFQKPLALQSLNLKTFYLDFCLLKNIIFKDVPKLTCLSLLATNKTEKIGTPQPYNTLNLFCSLSKIEELTYDLHLLEPLSENYPSIAPTPLENLKSLTIRSLDLCCSQDVLFTLCLIRSAPNLQNLTIHLGAKFWCGFESQKVLGEATKLLESEAKKYESYSSLQTIKIGGIAILQHEILLINLLQTCCPTLKSILIKT